MVKVRGMFLFIAGLLWMSMCGVVVYTGLWLCGVSTHPIGFLGAALIACGLYLGVYMIGRAIKDGEVWG